MPDENTVEKSARGRSHGQWLVDGRAPLNHNEQFTADGPPLEVRERIERVYAREGFASIDPDDLNGRFRWWGLSTQRRPGIPGGRTAQLTPAELSDEFFMLRVRLDGGALTTHQLRVLADVSRRYARGTARASCSAARSPGSQPRRSSTRRP